MFSSDTRTLQPVVNPLNCQVKSVYCVCPCSLALLLPSTWQIKHWMEERQKQTNTGRENRRMENRGVEEERQTSREPRDEGRDFSFKFDWRQ